MDRDFYYEQLIKRELKEIHVSGCRCNERLKGKTDGSIAPRIQWVGTVFKGQRFVSFISFFFHPLVLGKSGEDW